MDKLRKWKEQRRIVQCFLYDVGIPGKWMTETSVVVRIQHVAEDVLGFDASSILPDVGARIGTQLLISEAATFYFDDAAVAPNAHERSFESILSILLRRGSLCKILAPKLTQ